VLFAGLTLWQAQISIIPMTGDERQMREAGADRTISGWSGKVMNSLKRFLKDESGVTAIEYGLIGAGIAIVIIIAVQLVGTNLNAIFERIAAALTTA
jgi:pilus assembly protein Flp/PilA